MRYTYLDHNLGVCLIFSSLRQDCQKIDGQLGTTVNTYEREASNQGIIKLAMQPYSLDFRQKIIEVYELEKLSIRQLAKGFYIASSEEPKLKTNIREAQLEFQFQL